MSKETAVQLSAKKRMLSRRVARSNDRRCIVHYERNTHDTVLVQLTETGFDKIRQIVDERSKSSKPNVKLTDICTNVPAEYDIMHHGYHRWCYQNFTNTKTLKRQIVDNGEGSRGEKRTKRCSANSSVGSPLLPSDACLFCKKEYVYVKRNRIGLLKCMTQTANYSIHAAAMKQGDEDLLCVIRGLDLVAREAHYHSVCRRNYTRDSRQSKGTDIGSDCTIESKHQAIFDKLCKYVECNIIGMQCVERMTMVKERYLLMMAELFPGDVNENYKTDKLKDKLINHFGERIKFWQPGYRGELVYSDTVERGQAIETAFELACSEDKRAEEVALMLRRHVLSTHSSGNEMPWPPTASWFRSGCSKPPPLLQHFLKTLVSGKVCGKLSAKKGRFVESCSEDICYSISNGQWLMPKHACLAMTVRHLTGSAELLTILNRYGHCQSYTKTLELETAIFNSLATRDSIIPEGISLGENSVVHFCWDNFDLNEETPSGAGTTHSAHGIIIQELKTPTQRDTEQLPQMDKNRARSVDPREVSIPPCYVKSKVEPASSANATLLSGGDMQVEFDISKLLWLIARLSAPEIGPIVPSWAGWISSTANASTENRIVRSNVQYMTPINFPITDNSTVQYIIDISKQATERLGQKFTIVTFDLAVAKKSYAIVWQKPTEYANVIVRLGVFHTICSVLGTIGKMMAHSGFSEVVLEAGICASGSLNKVMSGKHFNRSLRVHTLMMECLERKLVNIFETTEHRPSELKGDSIKRLADAPNGEKLESTSCDGDVVTYLEKYVKFKQSVRDGRLGKTAQFWLSYVDTIWLVLDCLRATRENNLELHISSLERLCPLLFSMNHHNYARYLPFYLHSMRNLDKTHPGASDLLRMNGFSVCRSDVPASRAPVDITIEQTINRHAKSHGGIIGLSRNKAAYERWCVTRYQRAKYVEETLAMIGVEDSDRFLHKEMESASMFRSELSVQKLEEAFDNFLNPFKVVNKEELYNISSGMPAPVDVADDLLTIRSQGVTAMNDFINDRIIDKSVKFHDPIKKSGIKTFSSMVVRRKLKASNNKIVQLKAERNIFGQMVLLACQHNINLELTLTYPLGPIPWALATADGCPYKTDKSKLMHKLEIELEPVVSAPKQNTIHVYDGNALIQSLCGIPESFSGVAEHIFGILADKGQVHFVTDSYKENSIKSFERDRRGHSDTFLIAGPKTKTPRDWKKFLSNSENKTQLINLIFREWQNPKYAKKLANRFMFFSCQDECFSLTSIDGETVSVSLVQELCSTQEEADTKIVLHCLHASANEAATSTIIVRCSDTDVFIILLKYAPDIVPNILFDTGMGNKRRLLDIKEASSLHGVPLCSALPALHAFTGCDTVSSFVRKGKINALKIVIDNPDFLEAFTFGNTPSVSDRTYDELERFVCYLYGGRNYTDINKLRYDTFSRKFHVKSGAIISSCTGTDMSLLPPCRSSLKKHIDRANYQALVWNTSHVPNPDIPSPIGLGWNLDSAGNIDFDWTADEIAPAELVDILSNEECTEHEPSDREASDDESDIDCDLCDVICETDSDSDSDT